MTRQSYLRRRCARRYPVPIPTRYDFPPDPPTAVSRLDPHAAVSRLDSPTAVFAPQFARCGFRASIRPLRFSRLDLSRFGLVGASLSPGRGLAFPVAPVLCSLLPRRCPAAASATAAAKAKAKATHRHFRSGVGQSERGHLAEAEPTAPAARSEAAGFPGSPVRDARSAEWELMSPLSTARSARGHGFQMHHYRYCAGDPLKN